MRSQRSMDGLAALLFVASTWATISWCGSMASMDGMSMPGGWSMSMAWMRAPQQSWAGVAATFLGMWSVMMVAMMLPSLLPMLQRYRAALACTSASRVDALTLLAAGGYFCVWTLIGMVIFPLGVLLTGVEMQSAAIARAVPMVVGTTVIAAGALQFSRWKVRQLACCRRGPEPGRALALNLGSAWRYGVRLGSRCSLCCAGLTAILVVLGAMDLRVMTAVAAAVTVERLSPGGALPARIIGVGVIAIGLVLIVHAISN